MNEPLFLPECEMPGRPSSLIKPAKQARNGDHNLACLARVKTVACGRIQRRLRRRQQEEEEDNQETTERDRDCAALWRKWRPKPPPPLLPLSSSSSHPPWRTRDTSGPRDNVSAFVHCSWRPLGGRSTSTTSYRTSHPAGQREFLCRCGIHIHSGFTKFQLRL